MMVCLESCGQHKIGVFDHERLGVSLICEAIVNMHFMILVKPMDTSSLGINEKGVHLSQLFGGVNRSLGYAGDTTLVSFVNAKISNGQQKSITSLLNHVIWVS